MGISVSPTKPF